VCLGTSFIDHNGFCIAANTYKSHECECKAYGSCYCMPSGHPLYFNINKGTRQTYRLQAPQGYGRVMLSYHLLQGKANIATDLKDGSISEDGTYTVTVSGSSDCRGTITPSYTSRKEEIKSAYPSSAARLNAWF